MKVNYAKNIYQIRMFLVFINVAEESVTSVFSKRRWLSTKPFRVP